MSLQENRKLRPEIFITDRRYSELNRLANASLRRTPHVAELLLSELERAEIVPNQALPGNIVDLGSWVTFKDDDSGEIGSAFSVSAHSGPGNIKMPSSSTSPPTRNLTNERSRATSTGMLTCSRTTPSSSMSTNAEPISGSASVRAYISRSAKSVDAKYRGGEILQLPERGVSRSSSNGAYLHARSPPHRRQ